jgi:hypothetical protein
MTHHVGQSGQPAPQARLKVARHGALAECRVNNQAPQSPAGTAEPASERSEWAGAQLRGPQRAPVLRVLGWSEAERKGVIKSASQAPVRM